MSKLQFISAWVLALGLGLDHTSEWAVRGHVIASASILIIDYVKSLRIGFPDCWHVTRIWSPKDSEPVEHTIKTSHDKRFEGV